MTSINNNNNNVLINKCYCLLFSLLVFSNYSWLTNAKYYDKDEGYHTHTTHLTNLFSQQSICNPFPKVKDSNSLRVSHRYGPCSALEPEVTTHPTHMEILEHDKDRVEAIRDRVNMAKFAEVEKLMLIRQKVALPAMPGITLGTGNYVVTVGLGTPKKDLTLVFDTGSDFTWTQCAPCAKRCYQQQEPLFNPSQSSTYSNINCSSQLCTEVRRATSAVPGCSMSTCYYGIYYGDLSFSNGFLAKDTLTLGSGAYVPNFYFGCGEDNQGLFGKSAGLLGLGKNKFSAVSQSAPIFGNYFSYCLPSQSSASGHLTFGPGGLASKAIKYTSLLSPLGSSYYVDFQGITVDGTKLAIPPTSFSRGGTIIDSGTVITRLPPDAYTALRSAFNKSMSKYPKAPPQSILDTCYDLRKYPSATIPRISLLFGGDVSVDMPITGILYADTLSQVCLAFAGNRRSEETRIIGNLQQRTFDVVFDIAGGKLGFGAGGCL